MAYNYTNFEGGVEEESWKAFIDSLHPGSQAPDFSAVRLQDGKTVRLSDYTAESNVVLEFGSFT